MPEPGDDSEDLRRRLRENDEQALAEAFSLHWDRLWRLVKFRLDRRLWARVDAEDIVQEAYLNAAQRLEHLFDESSASVFLWLRLIVMQTLINVHRRHLGTQGRDAHREVSLRGWGGPQATTTSNIAQLVASATSPSQIAMRREVADRLEQTLENMDPIDREVLALRHFEELTNREVAAVLGIGQKAASMRYVRAVSRLKNVMNRTGEGEG
jgi:RNA polymerase sigma-70 factor (ECF subfamily)